MPDQHYTVITFYCFTMKAPTSPKEAKMDTKQEYMNLFSSLRFIQRFQQKIIVSNRDNEDNLLCLSQVVQ